MVSTTPPSSRSRLRLSPTSWTVRMQLPDALERVVLALDGDQHLIGGDQRVHRQQAERRRAVDEDDVVGVADRLERLAEQHLAGEGRDQLDLGPARSIEDGTTSSPGPPSRRASVDGHRVDEHPVGAGIALLGAQPEPRGGVALRVEVDDQHPGAELRERRSERDGGRRLPDARPSGSPRTARCLVRDPLVRTSVRGFPIARCSPCDLHRTSSGAMPGEVRGRPSRGSLTREARRRPGQPPLLPPGGGGSDVSR
jgi:hypothetical protein